MEINPVELVSPFIELRIGGEFALITGDGERRKVEAEGALAAVEEKAAAVLGTAT